MTGAARSGRAVLVAALTFFAVWTLCYQVALAASLPAVPALGCTLVGWVLVLGLLARRPGTGPSQRAEHGPPATRTMVVAAVVTALAWVLVLLRLRWLALGVGAVAAAAYLWRGWRAGRHHALEGSDVDEPTTDPDAGVDATRLWPLGWVLGVASAVLASVLVRPNLDDAFFVNVSAWVADRGTFPRRDTMLSDQAFPGLPSHTPNVSSIEGLFGVLAGLVGVPAPSVVYGVGVPVLTLFATLALTWLVADARIPAAPVGLAAATVGLWMSGGVLSFGHAPLRIWQGKIALAVVVVPLLLVTGLRLASRGGWRAHVVLGSAVVASVGMSNTAVFLTPLVLAGLAGAAWVVLGLRSALRVTVWMLYPVLVGVVIALTAPPGPSSGHLAALGDVVTSAAELNPLVAVPGAGISLVTSTVLALGIGWLGLRDRLLRAASLCLLLVTAAFLLPPVRDLASSAAGLGPVIWRVWWAVPVPLLMVGVVGAVADVVRRRPPVVHVALVGSAALVVALGPVVGGMWNLPPATATRWASPLTWKVEPGARDGAELALGVSRPGEVVLAPRAVSRVLAGLTVRVHPVVARMSYLPDYADVPAAHVRDRIYLQRFANGALAPTADTARFDAALSTVGVDTICVGTGRVRASQRLMALGFHPVGTAADIVCLRR